MPRFNLQQHLQKEHKVTPFSTYLREIVYGGNDGIVTTFAIVAGFAGAQKDPMSSAIPVVTVLLFGLANLLADGLSMGLGSFLSLRSYQDVYRNEKAKERHEIETNPEGEFDETIEILKSKGFSPKNAHTLATIYRSNPKYWLDFMMSDELEMQNSENDKPVLVAVSTFLSFAAFGIIPLLPYIFGSNITELFPLSVAATVGALLLLGMLRATVAKHHALRGILETLLVGVISATAAYIVGSFFRA